MDIVAKGKQYDSKPIKFQIDGKETCDEQAITNAFNNYLFKLGLDWRTRCIVLLTL